MRLAWLLSMLALATFAAERKAAATIWERAKLGDRSEERRMRASIENVLLGVGDERDLLQARVGLITLSRGEIQDPRTVVLLLRMRREMGLSSARSSKELLAQALKAELSLTERAWAELEFAYVHLSEAQLSREQSRGFLSGAEDALARGLEVAWQTQVRAEILNLRGLVGLRSGNTGRALEDFSEVTVLEPSRRSIVQAHVGQAFAFALRGEKREVAIFARRAFVAEATRAKVSRLDPFWDLQLSATEHECARALLLFGRADVLSSEDPGEANSTHSEACALLRPTKLPEPDSATGSQSAEQIWGAEIKRSLFEFYQEACARPAPPDVGEVLDPNVNEPGEPGSPPGIDKNHF